MNVAASIQCYDIESRSRGNKKKRKKQNPSRNGHRRSLFSLTFISICPPHFLIAVLGKAFFFKSISFWHFIFFCHFRSVAIVVSVAVNVCDFKILIRNFICLVFNVSTWHVRRTYDTHTVFILYLFYLLSDIVLLWPKRNGRKKERNISIYVCFLFFFF